MQQACCNLVASDLVPINPSIAASASDQSGMLLAAHSKSDCRVKLLSQVAIDVKQASQLLCVLLYNEVIVSGFSSKSS